MRELTSLNMSNQTVTANFFEGVIGVLSKNTSKDYSVVVMGKIKKDLMGDYPFFEYVNFVNGRVKVATGINDIETVKIGKLFLALIDIIGPSLLKAMILEELDRKTVKHLEKMGVRFLKSL